VSQLGEEELYCSVGKYHPVCMHCCAEDNFTIMPDNVLNVLLLERNPSRRGNNYSVLVIK